MWRDVGTRFRWTGGARGEACAGTGLGGMGMVFGEVVDRFFGILNESAVCSGVLSAPLGYHEVVVECPDVVASCQPCLPLGRGRGDRLPLISTRCRVVLSSSPKRLLGHNVARSFPTVHRICFGRDLNEASRSGSGVILTCVRPYVLRRDSRYRNATLSQRRYRAGGTLTLIMAQGVVLHFLHPI